MKRNLKRLLKNFDKIDNDKKIKEKSENFYKESRKISNKLHI